MTDVQPEEMERQDLAFDLNSGEFFRHPPAAGQDARRSATGLSACITGQTVNACGVTALG